MRPEFLHVYPRGIRQPAAPNRQDQACQQACRCKRPSNGRQQPVGEYAVQGFLFVRIAGSGEPGCNGSDCFGVGQDEQGAAADQEKGEK